MTLGSLFDGIGGFPYAAAKHGIIPVWASEIEPNCVEITKVHFPNMKHLGSVTDINGAEITPIDIISFGSPCQDLSIAGKQRGLDGERSGLFSEAIRIIYEMREATDGVYPTYAIWENVPGAFSSNKGADFRRVLEEITKTSIPIPKSGKWGGSGMVRTENCQLAWRTIDAQYWGVPQRRKRIYLVADFGGKRAGEILFKPEGLLGYTPQSRKAREESSDAARSCVKSAGFSGQNSITASPEYIAECALCLRGGVTPNCLQGVYEMSHANEVLRKAEGGICPTLQSRMGTGGNQVPIVFDKSYCIAGNIVDRSDTAGANGVGAKEDCSYTLNTVDRHAVAYCVDCRNLSVNCELYHTLQSKPGGGWSLNFLGCLLYRWIVRRLTPRECERLQGFPDDWTRYDTQGKEIKDSPRYKALGNSIAIPCAERVFIGILNAEEETHEDKDS